MTDNDIELCFSHHKPKEGDDARLVFIYEQALILAKHIHENCPDWAEKSIAIQRVREALMWACAGILCDIETQA